MRTLLIAPHADDETLFAAYLAQRHAAMIAVIYDEGRENELSMATTWLGCGYYQLHASKGMEEEEVEGYMIGLRDPGGGEDWERVIVPAEETGGHEEHNVVARCCARVFSDTEQIHYVTYAPRGVRSRTPRESKPDQPEHVARKLAALACYRSQIADRASGPWFHALLDMREWIA